MSKAFNLPFCRKMYTNILFDQIPTYFNSRTKTLGSIRLYVIGYKLKKYELTK